MPQCYELGTCDLTTNPLNTLVLPYSALIGDLIYPLVWGVILFVFWLRTHNPEYTGLVGILISGALIAGSITISPQTLYVGVLLFGVSMGIAMYRLITQRLFGAA